MTERTPEQFLMTVPAHQPNIDYAVRQLFGGDPDVSPKVTVLVNANLTAEQRLRLYSLTDQDLKDIRNGVNPVTIHQVEAVESEFRL